MLYEEIELIKKTNSTPNIPNYIISNIKHEPYFWQKEALENFLIYEIERKNNNTNTPTHLMFNMATGSGKTLLMSSLILYYYKKGYKHFLFFVNQNNIVSKTENNFIDKTHNKYLFRDSIVINNEQVKIERVDLFSTNPRCIEIKFTTIQKLHSDIKNVRENINHLDDLLAKDIIMLADEGHHFNGNTRNLSKLEIDIEKTWEYTVIETLLHKKNKDNINHKKNKNVLLEFSATIEENKNIIEKYRDKIIYKFDLVKFLKAGYTKEVNLIYSTLNRKERILHALLFNWYRHKIAIDNNISNFKPVILFRSSTIEESKKDYKYFLDITSSINENDYDFLKNIKGKIKLSDNIYEQGFNRTLKLLEYIKEKNIEYFEIVDFIKNNFEEKNIIITNSKDNKISKLEKTNDYIDTLLNNLEDKKNIIRAIFTVKRLTEGWDVLNLFDIVRLNTSDNTKVDKKVTIEERQLIGRGIRYFPFSYKNLERKKRKFDYENENSLRILEELNYYTYDEKSTYIFELKKELVKEGIIDESKNLVILENRKNRIDIDNNKKENFITLKKYYIKNPITYGSNILMNDKTIKHKCYISYFNNRYNKHIFYKVIHILYHRLSFNTIKDYIQIQTIDDLLCDNFLGDVPIYILSSKKKIDEIDANKKLNSLLYFLETFFKYKKYLE